MNKESLFEERLSKLKIVSLRMVTGEEVVARVNKCTSTYVVLDRPRVLIATLRQKPSGEHFMAAEILNWLNADPEQDVPVFFSDIVSLVKPDTLIEQEYIKFTTSIQI